MVKIQIEYQGDLHTQITHTPSSTLLQTDAPKDNQGRGESFSPTDLVAAALGSCMVTTMGIVAKRHGIQLEGTKVEVEKHMVNEPLRRIGKLVVRIQMPSGLNPSQRTMLEKTAHTCPVHKSLHADVEIPVQFNYPD